MQARLQDSKRAILDGSGNGTVSFGPGRPNERWTIQRVSCSVSTNTKEAQFKVYRGTAGVGSFVTGSVTGSTGDTDDGLNESLWSGETLSAQWTGGDVGAQAVVTYWGTIDV